MGNAPVAEWTAVGGGARVGGSQGTGSVPVAEWTAVERGDGRRKEADSGLYACSPCGLQRKRDVRRWIGENM